MDKAEWPRIVNFLNEIEKVGGPEARSRGLQMVRNKFSPEQFEEFTQMVKGSYDASPNFMKTITGPERVRKIAGLRALKDIGKKSLKSIPGIGSLMGLGAAMSGGDAAAAIPFLGDSEMAGPQAGSPEEMLESGIVNQEQFMKMLQRSPASKEFQGDESAVRSRASDLNSLLDNSKQYQGDESAVRGTEEDFTGENNFNRMNNMKQVQPMDEEQLNKFNKLKQLLGK